MSPIVVPENVPPLPTIQEGDIAKKIFMHRSVASRQTHQFEDPPNDPSPDNEKYEHLGDTVLNLVITTLLLNKHPLLHVGPATKIRSKLVGNHTLAQISVKYGLFDRLHVHPAQVVSLRESNKIQADLFEAFVGGLYLDQGLNAVEAWLVPLFDPLASDAYTSVREEYTIKPVPPGPSPARAGRVVHSLSAPSTPTRTTAGHLALFNQHLQRGNPTVEWAYSSPDGVGTSTTPVWEAAVIVNGEEYGRGRGNTKQNAKNEAAKVGLKRFDRRNQETIPAPT